MTFSSRVHLVVKLDIVTQLYSISLNTQGKRFRLKYVFYVPPLNQALLWVCLHGVSFFWSDGNPVL